MLQLKMEVGMKRGCLFLLFAVVALFSMGMGGLGGHPEGTVPDTDVHIKAEIRDRSGTVTNVDQFSMDGKTSLAASRGQGKLTIPFQNIETISFGEIKGDEVKVDVQLKSGDAVTLSIRSRALFYGSTGFGAFQIKSRDVASIAFP
jgi:hypothetical protein